MPVIDLKEVKKEHATYSRQSEHLEDSMRKHHQTRGTNTEYLTAEALLTRSNKIILRFKQLADALSGELSGTCDTACSLELAGIYYDWAMHHKQEAWFHYYYYPSQPESLQEAINANDKAIYRMEEAYEYYDEVYRNCLREDVAASGVAKAKKAAEDTAAMVSEYRDNAKFLCTEQASHKRKMSAADVGDEMSERPVPPRVVKSALNALVVNTSLDELEEGLTSIESYSSATSSGSALSSASTCGSAYVQMRFKKYRYQGMFSEARPVSNQAGSSSIDGVKEPASLVSSLGSPSGTS
jgi:hypothetical protein